MTHSNPQLSLFKTCIKCGRELPRSEYHRSSRNADGLNNKCKACRATERRAHYVANRESVLDASRAWYAANADRKAKTALAWVRSNPEKRAGIDARSRANHFERHKAREVVSDAVRAGNIPHISTQVCASCGEQAQNYHHPDYSRPLDVIPLCRVCHKEIHRQEANNGIS